MQGNTKETPSGADVVVFIAAMLFFTGIAVGIGGPALGVFGMIGSFCGLYRFWWEPAFRKKFTWPP